MKLTKKNIIGHGMFSRVYSVNETDRYVLIETDCFVKECSRLGWMPVHRMLPVHWLNDNDGPDQQIIMKRHDKVKKVKGVLNDKDYHVYKELRKVKAFTQNPYDSKDLLHKEFEKLNIHKSYKNMLHEVLDALGNYDTDIGFEISPRNIAINKGKLILLDCFFIKSQLNKYRNSHLKDDGLR